MFSPRTRWAWSLRGGNDLRRFPVGGESPTLCGRRCTLSLTVATDDEQSGQSCLAGYSHPFQPSNRTTETCCGNSPTQTKPPHLTQRCGRQTKSPCSRPSRCAQNGETPSSVQPGGSGHA